MPENLGDNMYDRSNLGIRHKYQILNAGGVLSDLAVRAHDQLRQKVAWGLSQQFVISGDGFPRTHVRDIEQWTQYHDIFVRHAFGNLRDVMREVTYSPMQGKYLTFLGSRSFARSGTYPDENFAREFSKRPATLHDHLSHVEFGLLLSSLNSLAGLSVELFSIGAFSSPSHWQPILPNLLTLSPFPLKHQ